MSRRSHRPQDDATPAARRQIRCAIYTRKSSEEGLEQEYNSLDAQRESAEAYIASQKAQGWVCLPTRYDDGGFSGGNMDRPAMARLSHDTLTKARKVVAQGTPELVKAMDDGTASVSAAAAVASLPPQRQRQIVAAGKDAIATTAAKLRAGPNPRRPGLVKAVERLEALARLTHMKLNMTALREAVADLRKELGSLLS